LIYDIAILGAGASSLMTASNLSLKYKICIIDKNDTMGAKIKISGGKKCNITNKYLNSDKYLGDKEFIKKVFSQFNNQDLLNFLNKNEIYPTINENMVKGAYFCNKSQDVINMFEKLTKNIKYYLNHKIIDTKYKDGYFLTTTNKNIIKSKKLIVALGGLSYPILNASNLGIKIAQSFGHTINTTNPALVGFTVQKEQFWFKELSGLSLDYVKIKVNNSICEGGLLFTHKGCSGPAILNTSLYWTKRQISINFAPNKNSYLPKRFKKIIKDKNIDIYDYTFSPAGNFGYTKAEVTKGGVSCQEISYKNMESKLKKDLYFVGEVLDITGELGGYNFQWAFSSAIVCAKNLK
jgi:predicted Rossmann fold flavoprotein